MECLLGIDPEKTKKCKPSECASCGWEAAEAARRREYVKEHGLTLCADGFRRLIIRKEKDMATPYKECPHCGAHLDSGEKCECRAEEIEAKNSQKYACGLTEQDVESGWECPLDNAQLQAWFDEYQSLSAAEYNTLVSYMNSLKLQGNTQYEAFEQHMADFETQAAADFNAWFNGLQNVLDDNAATNLLNITNALDARVDMLEAVLFNDITTNPFLILFDDLDGVTSTGIWNESLQRIEC